MAFIVASPCICTNDSSDDNDKPKKTLVEKILELLEKGKDKLTPNELIEKLERLVDKAAEFPQAAQDFKEASENAKVAAEKLEKIGPKLIWHATGAGIVFVSAATFIVCAGPKIIANIFGT